MKKNTGTKSEKLFESILNDHYGKNVFVERLPDTKSIKGMMGTGFIQGRPSDYLVTENGVMYYAEVKSCQDEVSFPFSNFTKEQEKAMIRQNAAGGEYFIFIHNLLTDTWYKLSARQKIEVEKSGRKSIKWTELNKWELI